MNYRIYMSIVVKARNEFRENLLLLENQVEKYLKFTNIDGWYFYRK